MRPHLGGIIPSNCGTTTPTALLSLFLYLRTGCATLETLKRTYLPTFSFDIVFAGHQPAPAIQYKTATATTKVNYEDYLNLLQVDSFFFFFFTAYIVVTTSLSNIYVAGVLC